MKPVQCWCLCVFIFALSDTFASKLQTNNYGLKPGFLTSGHSNTYSSQIHSNHQKKPKNGIRRSSDVNPDAQRYFPSFSNLFDDAPPFVNSRPSFYEDSIFRPSFRTQEYNQNNYREQRDSFPSSPPASSKDLGMLGSGNFGVIRGGTYYAEERDSEGEFALDSDLLPYYDGNGHGRPPFFRGNPKPLYKNGGNFFENFRDFADITPPSKSFSEYYVVYVNKNSTGKNPNEATIIGPEDGGELLNLQHASEDEDLIEPSDSVKRGPKNILEQLAIIDETNAKEKDESSKLSKNKRKLLNHKTKESLKESRLKAKILQKTKNPYDPLLALS